jgi:type II secretory pathway pseudopilin PulG
MANSVSCGPLLAGAKAFSLVEVVVALGISTFVLVILVGLLPVGLLSNRNAIQETQTVNLLQMITADRLNSPAANASTIYQLPPLNNAATVSSTLWVNEDQITTSTTPSSSSRYRVAYSFFPSNSTQPVLLDFKVSLATAATNLPPSLETTVSVYQ